ncbi:hypothetical protein CAEBREN_12316 [Caenorhabditis brenneri]|uniref:Sdz-33 F-box domain-containing protein n=1 Tax=Caenorhabditis brenneri TaxID=135651 RepID=G0P1X4_CAEBE|nr:hypothetical protein CAEBREN_12316 [Caenorhabditis brenneri]
MAFRLLKLPMLVQKMIFSDIDFSVIIYLSTQSTYFQKHLGLVQLPVLKFIFIMTEHPEISFKTKSNTVWIEVSNEYKKESEKPCKINEVPMQICKISNHLNPYFLVSNDKMENHMIFEHLMAHFLSFLEVKEFELRLRMQNIDFPNCSVFKYTQKFSNVQWLGLFESEPRQVFPEDLIFVLEQIDTKSLHINLEPPPNFIYKFAPEFSRPNLEELRIGNSNWLDFETLLHLDIKSITCNLQEDPSKKANWILKKWVPGRHQKLEDVILDNFSYSEFDDDVIFDGVDKCKSIFENNEFIRFKSPIKQKFDINREFDGTLASVVFVGTELRLFVWTNKRLRAVGRMEPKYT